MNLTPTTKTLAKHCNCDLVNYYHKGATTRPRAAIVIHKTLEPKCWELSNFTFPDLVAVIVKIRLESTALI